MVNEEIRASRVRVVVNGKADVVDKKTALKMAEDQGMDLICVDPRPSEPVCIIEDYKKYTYEKMKKEKESRKKAKASIQELKEIRISPDIQENDLKTKAKNINRMLKENNKVKLTITYRGRTIRLIKDGPERLSCLADMISEKFKVDKPAKIEGNNVSMIVAPVK